MDGNSSRFIAPIAELHKITAHNPMRPVLVQASENRSRRLRQLRNDRATSVIILNFKREILVIIFLPQSIWVGEHVSIRVTINSQKKVI
jgi:hypothetical protein